LRFLKDGPSIPDELLWARDEGRVVFFCGSGVSRARAGLPDFYELAKAVSKALRVQPDHDAAKLIAFAEGPAKGLDIPGIVSADRVFGKMEEDFDGGGESLVEREVAKALRPTDPVDTSAHAILLDLATTPDRRVQLVTTNFDRLFEQCRRKVKPYDPLNLPRPSQPKDIDGIVYLHGKANENYTGAEGHRFVLSTSTFGRAYLAEGWASTFIKDILAHFTVVFVGYTADDPPMQYLLEALKKDDDNTVPIYAFQEGADAIAAARWKHKGVTAIGYKNPAGDHAALWDTLESWAARARDLQAWQNTIVALAQQDPKALKPHERGQVAHLISNTQGMRLFAEANPKPPAEWLCVFDPGVRYATPKSDFMKGELEPVVDPFGLYGLDSDILPDAILPDDHSTNREIPDGAWNAFSLLPAEFSELTANNVASFSGANTNMLNPRLAQLGSWLYRTIDQPASVWWAAKQNPLHPNIQSQIQWNLRHSPLSPEPAIKQAWRILLESWSQQSPTFGASSRLALHEIGCEGFDHHAFRRLERLWRPHLKISPSHWQLPFPPADAATLKVESLLNHSVSYPDVRQKIDFPDEFLSEVIRILQQCLLTAHSLEREGHEFRLNGLPPIIKDDDPEVSHSQRHQGLSGMVLLYTELFERLIAYNRDAALNAVSTWHHLESPIFDRLRIWATGSPSFLSHEAAANTFINLADGVFWDRHHRRDILIALSRRWVSFQDKDRIVIENRILAGRPIRDDQEAEKHAMSAANDALNFTHWLASQGCTFTFNLQSETDRLRKLNTTWQPEYAAGAAASLGTRQWSTHVETDPTVLLQIPISEILPTVERVAEESNSRRIENKPFFGLVSADPLRAFDALKLAATQNSFPVKLWWRLIEHNSEANVHLRLTNEISDWLQKQSPSTLAALIDPLSTWLKKEAQLTTPDDTTVFPFLMDSLVSALELSISEDGDAPDQDMESPDWVSSAINNSAGWLTEALVNKLPKETAAENGLPAWWTSIAGRLLNLSGNSGSYALVILAFNLNFFHHLAPRWASENLLNKLDSNEPTKAKAFWAGYDWGGILPFPELLHILKPYIIQRTFHNNLDSETGGHNLAALVTHGWGALDEKTGERFISNEEMDRILVSSDELFRLGVLHVMENWLRPGTDLKESKWVKLAPELLQNAWPKQRAMKSSNITRALSDLAFSNTTNFPETVSAVVDHIVPYTGDCWFMHNLSGSVDEEPSVIDKYPEATLSLLHAILPENANIWPYDAFTALEKIATANPALKSDLRFIELQRRWDAR